MVELLVVIGIIALLIAILLPALNKARDAGYRVSCGSNLHQIGIAMLVYAQDNKGSFPRTYWLESGTNGFTYYNGSHGSPGSGDKTYQGIRAFTNPGATDPFSNPTAWNGDDATDANQSPNTKRPGDNDITAALFLLVRVQHLNPGVFVCPGRGIFFPDNLNGMPFNQRSNFSSPFNLSYSVNVMMYPYTQQVANNLNIKWNVNCNPGVALMADLNPGESFNGPYGQNCVVTASGFYGGTGPQTPGDSTTLQKRANSNNHKKAGQNVLYADGHVTWATNAFAGYHQDNIYTQQGSATATTGTNNVFTSPTQFVMPPISATDSILEPNDGAITSLYGIGIY